MSRLREIAHSGSLFDEMTSTAGTARFVPVRRSVVILLVALAVAAGFGAGWIVRDATVSSKTVTGSSTLRDPSATTGPRIDLGNAACPSSARPE